MTVDRDRLTVLYDADCGLCRLTVRALSRLDWWRRLAFLPLQGFEPSAPGDPRRGELRRALHVRDVGGRWRHGGEAMLQIARAVPVLAPLSVLGRLPGMSRPIERGYRLVAENRRVISRLLRIR